jgi:catabolite regulation protein CreA
MGLLLVFTAAGAGEATVATKNIKASYENIKLMINGKQVVLPASQEPFIINGTTYLSVRSVAEALGCYVTWLAEAKTVAVTGTDTSELAILKAQATQKDNEIQNLKTQLAQKDQQVQDLYDRLNNSSYDDEDEDDDDDDEDIADLEDQLNDDYDEIGDVAIDKLDLSGDEDDLDVEIEVDLDEYDSEWEDLSDSNIKSWIKNMVNEIQDELSDDTGVDGEIIDNDSDDVLVEFNKDGDDDLEVDFKDDDYRGIDSNSDADASDVIDYLEGKSYDVGDIDFEIDDVNYTASSNKATVNLDARDDDAGDDWDDLNNSEIENDVEKICEKITDAFEDEDVDLDIIKINFYDEHSSLIDDFEYDVDDESLD